MLEFVHVTPPRKNDQHPFFFNDINSPAQRENELHVILLNHQPPPVAEMMIRIIGRGWKMMEMMKTQNFLGLLMLMLIVDC